MRLLVAILALAAPVFGQSLCSYTVSPNTFSIGNQSFTGSITVTPTSGGFCTGWLATVDPSVSWVHITSGASGNGPGTVNFTADANPNGTDRRGTMTVAGTPILLTQSANACSFTVSPTSANFAVTGGTGSLQVTANCSWQASVDQNWISIPQNNPSNTNGPVTYNIAPNPCVPARTGSVIIQTGLASPPVVAVKQDGSTANLTLSASSVTVDSGASDQRVLVNTGNGCQWSASSDVSWLQITAGGGGSGNGSVAFHVQPNNPLATRTGNIKVTAAGVIGGVFYTVTQPAAGPPMPLVTAVENAASYATGAVSPGEIVTIFGNNMGPAKLVLYQLTGGAFPTSIAGTQVLFDGVPAPMIYASQTQVSAVAPYGLAGKTTTNVQVQYQGATSSSVAAPVQAATPGVFSLDASGLGPGAILNQDYSINSGPNPAAKGSVVAIYCTGGGTTDPASVDGSITGTPLPMIKLPVTVTIGDLPAKVWYSGGAPQAIAGLTQINAEVPGGVKAGPSVPVVVTVGTWQSQAGVTMAVK